MSEPVLLDTTSIGYFADNKIYTTSFSEDKSKILIHKRNVKNDELSIASRLYSPDFSLIDSTRETFEYSRRNEYFSELFTDNTGNIVYVKLSDKRSRNETEKAMLCVHKLHADTFTTTELSLQNKYIEDVFIKIDNLNKNCIINAFYYGTKKGNIDGLCTATKDLSDDTGVKISFNDFDDLADMSTTQGKKFNFEIGGTSTTDL